LLHRNAACIGRGFGSSAEHSGFPKRKSCRFASDRFERTAFAHLSKLQAINGDESNDLETALDVVAAATGSNVSDASDLNNLCE
jgi:hypothetical protein